LNEGKQLYLAGKYDEALENFKIAEFGLLDEKESLSELYFYYALANYKKGALGESKLLLERMKAAMGITDINTLPQPKEIERDLYIMIRAQQYLDQPGAKDFSLVFFNLFYQTLDLIGQNKFKLAEANLKRLEKTAGDDLKLPFLQGVLAFQQGDYKKCIKHLEKIAARLGEEFREDAAFFLAVSFLKRNDLVNGNKYSKEIKNPDYVHRLMVIMDELKAKQQPPAKKK
jgi:tetratricopeptide (TPR) repeat protein